MCFCLLVFLLGNDQVALKANKFVFDLECQNAAALVITDNLVCFLLASIFPCLHVPTTKFCLGGPSIRFLWTRSVPMMAHLDTYKSLNSGAGELFNNEYLMHKGQIR